jgi:hypothetical protein
MYLRQLYHTASNFKLRPQVNLAEAESGVECGKIVRACAVISQKKSRIEGVG